MRRILNLLTLFNFFMAEYKKDINDEDILYGSSEDHQYMMEWEREYMEACVDYLNPHGDILEIGFGMGYSADRIHSYDISSHTILEPDPVVYKKALEWAKKYDNVIIHNQGWPCCDNLLKYDCFFYDPYIEEKPEGIMYDDACDVTFFVVKCIHDHMKEKSKFSFYCSSQGNSINDYANFLATSLYNIDNTSVEFKLKFKKFDVEVPKHCNYCKSGWLYTPVISVEQLNKN